MLKATLSVLFLSAAQNVTAITLQSKVEESVKTRRAPRLTQIELNELVNRDLATDVYEIGNGEPLCALNQVKRTLRQFYRREHNCNYRFDREGQRPNETQLQNCLNRNEATKASRIDVCLASDDQSQNGSVNNDTLDNNNGGNNTDNVSNNDQVTNSCPGIPSTVTISDYCTRNFGCLEIKEVYDYTLLRLGLHNDYRSNHRGTNPLALNLDIACQAKTWSDNMAENDIWEHSSRSQRPNQGENLAMSWGGGSWNSWLQRTYTPEIGWYDEEEPNYNYATGRSNGGQIGHFTQMVWKNSTELGCGESRIRRGNTNYTYSTCRYSPPGNWRGQNTQQVGAKL